MAGGNGVSIEDMGGGRWRLRWRTKRAGGGWHSREKVLDGSQLQAEAVAVKVRQLRTETDKHGPTADELEEVIRGPAPAAGLLDGLEAFIASREAAGRFKPKTATTYRSYTLRLVEGLHAITRTPEDRVLPVTVLTRENLAAYMARDQVLRVSQMMRYAPMRLLLDCWRWMADDPTRWPQVPPAPRSTADYLPRTPKYGRTVAPTMAHVDACLRHLSERAPEQTRVLGLLLRFTGLRANTLLAVDRGDIDLREKTLYVRADKNDYHRHVPLADALLDEVEAFIEAVPEGPVFRKRRHSTRTPGARVKKPSETFRAAWQAATDAGEAPEHVWNPPNRTNARPEHGIRAAFDAALIGAGVRPEVVDYLVGRNEADVRARHYGRELLDEARRAVNGLPPVDWEGPRAERANVVRLAQAN